MYTYKILKWAFTLLVVATAALVGTAAAVHLCKPQGLLLLDKPYQQPQRVDLPFCQQYGCSCCNASHALTLQRASRAIATDEDLSSACKQGLLRLACRVCDPDVGTGLKHRICESTCDQLFEACKQDFFAYEPSTGLITPCTQQMQDMLVCSQLTDLANSAADFCKAAGYGPVAVGAAPDEPCFDGAPVGPEACPESAPRTTPQGSPRPERKQHKQSQNQHSSQSSKEGGHFAKLLRRWRRFLRRRLKQGLPLAAELLIGLGLASFMAWAVVAALKWAMQPTRRRGPRGPPPTNAREVMARAAEARRRATVKR